jgi:hypothetical protein
VEGLRECKRNQESLSFRNLTTFSNDGMMDSHAYHWQCDEDLADLHIDARISALSDTHMCTSCTGICDGVPMIILKLDLNF